MKRVGDFTLAVRGLITKSLEQEPNFKTIWNAPIL